MEMEAYRLRDHYMIFLKGSVQLYLYIVSLLYNLPFDDCQVLMPRRGWATVSLVLYAYFLFGLLAAHRTINHLAIH